MIARLLFATAVAIALSLSVASADFQASDPVSGATLLLPYFELDLDTPNGSDTMFRVHNGQPARVFVARVTLWTDWAIPTFGFDLILGPNEQRDVFLREVFNGRIPAPFSPFVQPFAETRGVSFSGCSSKVLESDTLAHIRAAHTGLASAEFLGLCSGIDHGDNVARGFVTVDIASNCSGDSTPFTLGYFGSEGVVGNSNVLSGHYAITQRGDGVAFGEMLLPIESNTNVSGATFYSEFAASGGEDSRERLASEWGASFVGGEGVGTDMILWRDPLAASEPVECGGAPFWFPLFPAEVILSDPDGNTIDIAPAAPFPAATNRVRVGSLDLPTIYESGFLSVRLPPAFEVAKEATTSGILSPLLPQGHLTAVHFNALGYASAYRGTNLQEVPSE